MADVPVPDLMTMDELVARLGLSKTKLDEMQRNNQLPFPVVRIGGRVMFSRRAYFTWLSRYDLPPEEDHDRADNALSVA